MPTNRNATNDRPAPGREVGGGGNKHGVGGEHSSRAEMRQLEARGESETALLRRLFASAWRRHELSRECEETEGAGALSSGVGLLGRIVYDEYLGGDGRTIITSAVNTSSVLISKKLLITRWKSEAKLKAVHKRTSGSRDRGSRR